MSLMATHRSIPENDAKFLLSNDEGLRCKNVHVPLKTADWFLGFNNTGNLSNLA